jgi:hypothetical protein
MTHMAVMVNLRAGIAPMDSQARAVTASLLVYREYVRLEPFPINLSVVWAAVALACGLSPQTPRSACAGER